MADCNQCLDDELGWGGITCNDLKRYGYCGYYDIIQYYCPESCADDRAKWVKEYEDYQAEKAGLVDTGIDPDAAGDCNEPC